MTTAHLMGLGLSAETIDQAVNGKPVSAIERLQVQHWKESAMKNPEFVKSFLAGDPEAGVTLSEAAETFVVHGLGVRVGGDWPEVVEALRRDFAWWASESEAPAQIEVEIRRRTPDYSPYASLPVVCSFAATESSPSASTW